MIKLAPNTVLTERELKKVIENHRQSELPRLQTLENYYLNNNAINLRVMSDDTKPNNKISHPYASYITDTLSGYFMGEPITYSSTEEDAIEEIKMIFEYNDEADENVELARHCSIYGVAYELLYIDEEGDLRFKYLDPKECIPIFDDTIENDLLGFIRYYFDYNIIEDKTYMYIEYITDKEMVRYKGDELGNTIIEVDRIPHHFGMVPIAIYKNNDDMIGDFEEVISLIDAYDKLESDSLNDFEYFCDAYLALIGFTADADDVKAMKENRVLLLDKDTDAKWLIKEEQDSTVENIKSRINEDIHKFSKCPNMADENFAGNSSGVAIKYKMLGTENLISVKERKFKRGIQRRLELMSTIVNIINGAAFDWRGIKITFTRNLPANETELANMVNTLDGIVSTETLLAQLPFIDDVQGEMDKLEKEKEANPFYDVRMGLRNEDEDGGTEEDEDEVSQPEES